MLTLEQKQDFLTRGFSRRTLGRMAALLTAGAGLPFYNEAALAQLSKIGRLLPGAVKINANENPLGPCAEAAVAIHNAVKDGGRYNYEEADTLVSTFAELEVLREDHVMPFAGSSDPLHRAVLAFTSPTRGLVLADPSYEAGDRAARFVGAKVTSVPLRADYSHDVRRMVQADPNAGVIYVCNPNNPTGSLTSRADIEYLLAHQPKGCLVLLDEAYIHLCDAPACLDLAAAGKDIIVLRTFSKIYGMAGLRAGLAIGRPDLLEKLRGYGAGALPLTAMVAAIASLKARHVVPQRRKIIRDNRENVFDFLSKRNFSFVPSVSNKFMLDVKRPGQEVIQALAAEKIYIGRVWSCWPTHVRVTVGTREEMDKFQAALLKVMA